MGTNYYLKQDVCTACGRGDELKHIGKSSMGWCFALRVYPEEGIQDLADWDKLLKKKGSVVEDEYGRTISRKDLLDLITNRSFKKRPPPEGYASWKEYYLRNDAAPGPNNLNRHVIDGLHCIGHGLGTWDLLTGEFS